MTSSFLTAGSLAGPIGCEATHERARNERERERTCAIVAEATAHARRCKCRDGARALADGDHTRSPNEKHAGTHLAELASQLLFDRE